MAHTHSDASPLTLNADTPLLPEIIARHARHGGQREALVTETGRLTWDALAQRMNRIANGFAASGSTTIEAVRTRVERIDWLKAGVNQGFLEPVFLWFLLAYVFTRYYVLGNQLDTVAAYLHDFSGDSQREIVSLRHIIKKQNRKLEAQTEMLEFLIEEEEDDIVEYRRKKKVD